ncbi:hypothetical protein BVX99_01610 [bacterium F16]|nr:hypothetical protein BVX99_01610 [bacterium F16]
MITPKLLSEAIDFLNGAADADFLVWYMGAILISYSASSVCRFYIRQTLIVMSRKVEYDLRQDLWSHLQTLDQSFFATTATGDIMSRLSSDVESARMFPGPTIMYFTDGIFRLIFMVGLMLYFNPLLTVAVLIPLPILAGCVYYISKQIHERFTRVQESLSDMTSRVQQDFSGIRVIKSYTCEENEIEHFQETSERFRQEQLELAKIQALFRPILMFVPSLSGVIILGFGGWLITTDAPWVARWGFQMSTGDITAFMMCLFRIVWPIMAMGWVTSMAQRADASMKRLNGFLKHAAKIKDHDDCEQGIEHLTGDLEFDNVTLTFPGMAEPALSAVSTTLKEGSTVAVIGRTGSGKSSFVNLIPRLLDPVEGDIRIGGKSLKNVPLKALRQKISIAPQEAFLFSETLRNNIRFGKDAATAEAIDRAVTLSCLDNDLKDFPAGLESKVGERGLTLSGGQKQRCSLARALVAEPDILILDDTMSAVDTATEEQILQNLKTVMKGRTTILISHRISTVKDADKIIVFDKGTIAEEGTHTELLERGGIYFGIHQRQLLEREIEAS